MDMDQQFYDDQIFSDLGGSKQQQQMKNVAPVKPQQKKIIGGPLDDATITKQKVGDGFYALHFSLKYETRVGETLAVVGSLKELGEWKNYNCHLTW